MPEGSEAEARIEKQRPKVIPAGPIGKAVAPDLAEVARVWSSKLSEGSGRGDLIGRTAGPIAFTMALEEETLN